MRRFFRFLPALSVLALATGCAQHAVGPTHHDLPGSLPGSMVLEPAGMARMAPFLDHVSAHDGDFVARAPVSRESEQWTCFNTAPTAWQVERVAGEMTYRAIDPGAQWRDPLPESLEGRLEVRGMPRRLVWPTADGLLVSLSSVDAGAELWFVPRESEAPTLLTAKHVVAFVNTERGLLAAVGQSYVTSEYGELLEIARTESGWVARPFVDLREVPRAVSVQPDGMLLVVTPRSLLRIDPHSGRSELLHEGSWIALSPNSVAVGESGVIHIGMRQAVVRLDPDASGYRERWLVPTECPTLVPDGAGKPCACSDQRPDAEVLAQSD